MKVRAARVLDFDCEARPLSWYGGDFVTKEITAIAAQFIGEKKMHVWALGEDTTEEMLRGFFELYTEADIVTGHFIRGFDLPLINGMLLEAGNGALPAKLAHDTKIDLIGFSGLSKSQENLAAMLGIKSPKISMNQEKWRQANRLTPRGIALTKARVKGDVVQNIEMRAELMKRGMLEAPKRWSPRGVHAPEYQP